MSYFKKVAVRSAMVVIVATSGLAVQMPVLASDAGAFVGGMMASRVMRNMHERTQAEQVQAYNSQVQTQQMQRSSAPAAKSTEQRLAELDKLAAGGYITPAEYKSKKAQIVNSI